VRVGYFVVANQQHTVATHRVLGVWWFWTYNVHNVRENSLVWLNVQTLAATPCP